jgi:hypothetical protein
LLCSALVSSKRQALTKIRHFHDMLKEKEPPREPSLWYEELTF